MNTATINGLLNHNPITRRYYRGCYAVDQIPPIKDEEFPQAMVVNEDPQGKPGSHWVGIFVKSKHEVYYFDSFARKPKPQILKYLEQFPNVEINKYSYQSHFTDVCGHYVLFFIYQCCLGYSMEKIERILGSYENPDRYVHYFVHHFV